MTVLGVLCAVPSALNVEFYVSHLRQSYNVMTYTEKHINVVGVILSILEVVYIATVLKLWSNRQTFRQINTELPLYGSTALQKLPPIVDDS
ncbi:MAG: hypothetical protein Q9174_005490, partial [Haloplaca sp. 1 TL-2023]